MSKSEQIINKVSEFMREKQTAFMYASAKGRAFEAALMSGKILEIEKSRQECIDSFTAYLDKCVEVNHKLMELEKTI